MRVASAIALPIEIRRQLEKQMRRRSTAQGAEGRCVLVLPRVRRAQLEQYAAYADSDHSADLDQLEADGIDLRLGPLCGRQAQPSLGFHQRVG